MNTAFILDHIFRVLKIILPLFHRSAPKLMVTSSHASWIASCVRVRVNYIAKSYVNQSLIHAWMLELDCYELYKFCLRFKLICYMLLFSIQMLSVHLMTLFKRI